MGRGVKMRRVGSWVSLIAAGHVAFASAAHAQEPPAAEPPAAAPPAAAPPAPPATPPPAPQAYDPDEAPPAPRPYAPPPPPPAARRQAQPGWYPPAQYQNGFMYPPPTGPVVRLSSSNPRARLQTMQLKWRDVCAVPCGVRVDPGAVYRIGGGTIRASEEFTMPRASGVVYVNTEVGSKVKHGVGLGLTIGGAVSVAVGGLMLALRSDTRYDDPYGYDNSTNDVLTFYGVVYLVTGLALLAAGIPLSLSSTSVEVR